MMRSRYNKGKEGERAAAEHLSSSGIKILDRNFRCPLGEIDLVAKDGKTIVTVFMIYWVISACVFPKWQSKVP
jgi:putative endonuclease